MHPSDLRIALFSGNYNYVRDGANQSLNRLAGHFLANGAKVRVYSPTTAAPAFEPTGDLVSVPSIALPGGRGEYRLALGLPRSIRDDLAAYKPNLVHVSAPDWLGHRAIKWARQHHVPIVASFHTRFETYLRYYGLQAAENAMIGLLTRFYNRVDRIVVPGQSIADLLRGWGVTTPIGIWTRGIDHDRFNPSRRDMAWRRSLGIADDQAVVGFLGRLVKEKGLDIFADVAAMLHDRQLPARALIVGKGPAHDWFKQRVPDAVFTGHLTGDDLGRAVASMDVLFNPSVTEGFGNVTTEAMASGVPVVAARATGAIDLIDHGKTGFLVEPRDVGAYFDAIQRIATNPALRAQMGEDAHRSMDGYRWDSVNDHALQQFCALVGAGRQE